MRLRLLALAEAVVIAAVLVAAVSLLLVTVSAVSGHGRPATPAAPAPLVAPRELGTPAPPEGAPVTELSLALLEVSVGARRSREVELTAVLRRLGGGRDVAPLAGALGDGFRARGLPRELRGRVAVALAGPLAAAPGNDLEAAIGEVPAALAAAGLGAPAVLVVERELRRAAGERP